MRSFVIAIYFFYLFVELFNASRINIDDPEVAPCYASKKVTFLEKIQGKANEYLYPWSCTLAVKAMSILVSRDAFKSSLVQIATKICIVSKMYSKAICEAYVQSYKDQIIEILRLGILVPSRICYGKFVLYKNWTMDIPSVHPYNGSIPAWPSVSDKSFNIIHIADVHLDNDYSTEGAPLCKEPLCCHNDSTPSDIHLKTSKKFGEYNCDSPRILFDSVVSYVASMEGDIVYYTGDSVPHAQWRQTKETVLGYNDYILKTLRSKFPNKKIYPCLGNHESNPVDSYPGHTVPEKDLNDWLYHNYAELNKKDLDMEALKTIPYGGYYTTLIRKGLRLISLNTNFCETHNFWMIIDNEDPYNQLHWLYKVLLEAQLSGEKVHILGHHPFGTDTCNNIWSYNLNRIISRFRHTVTAIFTGHTHKNEFQVRFDPINAVDIEHVIHVGASITPYIAVNPGFNIYKIDDSANSSFVVVDILTHSLDINDQNPNWKLISTLKSTLGMKDLSPQSYVELVKRMNKDEDLFKTYLNLSYRREVTEKIDKKAILCQLLVSVDKDDRACKNILRG